MPALVAVPIVRSPSALIPAATQPVGAWIPEKGVHPTDCARMEGPTCHRTLNKDVIMVQIVPTAGREVAVSRKDTLSPTPCATIKV